MKFPLLPIFIAYAAGVIIQVYSHISLEGWLLFGFLSLPLLVLLHSKLAAQICCLLAAGGVITWWQSDHIQPHDLRALIGSEPALAAIRGSIIQSPEERAYQAGAEIVIRTLTRLEVTEIKTNETWAKASGIILVNNRGKLPEHFFRTRKVEIDGIIKTPPEAPAPNMFDYRKYLRWQRVYYQFETENEKAWSLHGEPGTVEPASERFRRWAFYTLGRGVEENSESLQLLRAMVLGWRANLAGEISTPFMRTGTMHIFAISGLHITLIAGLLMGISAWCRALFRVGLNRKAAAWVVIPLLWAYTFATGMQASAVRASVMSTLFILAYVVERPHSYINALAAAACIILVIDPLQLFQASFQLSFSVVLVLLLMMSWTKKSIEWLKKSVVDEYLPQALVNKGQRRRIWILRMVFVPGIVSAASWIGSIPLTLHYFNLLTPSGFVVNLLVVPLTSIALGVSVLNLLLGHVIAPLCEALNTVAWWMMELAVQSTTTAATWSISYFYFPKPDPIFFILFYAIVFAWLLNLELRTRMAATMAAAMLMLIFFGSSQLEARFTTTIAVLPVQGSPVFIDAPGLENDLLIDCSRLNESRNFLPRYFHAQGVDSVPNVLITHGDIAHLEGYVELAKEFRFQNTFVSPVPHRSRPYKDLLASIPPLNLHTNAQDGQTICGFRILHPPAKTKASKADDHVAVMFKEFKGWKLLTLGDLSPKGQL
ncbi:MAG: ComEC/Rec2 family competence protein, partial [Verrucomicrobiales bacterium]